jgi:SAM-dependent methyltransferase
MPDERTPLEIEELIRQHAPEAARRIREAAAAHPGDEANFRRPVEQVVEEFARQVELRTEPRHEYTLLNGRADSVYNRLVVEYEAPGTLRKENSYRGNKHAIGQVRSYIEALHRVERQRVERMAGVVLDGSWFIFVRFKDDRWQIDDPLPVEPDSTERFLRYLNALSTELAITPDNLIRDFGENKRISRACVSRLYRALTTSQHRKVKVLFDQWSLQFSEICGYEAGSPRLDVHDLGRRFGVTDRNPDAFRLFFAIHTYYATFIKLLAVQIASFYAFPRLGTGLQQVANYSSDQLHAYLVKMERGGVFKDFGINNFLEGDFFGWYLDIWDDEIDRAVREIIKQLANYSLITLDVDPEATRDLLKRLYQNLMPKQLRHDLGEYYTPDWLAERLLNQLDGGDFRGDPDKRLLDPACGSGTFLVLAIRKIRQRCADQMIPEHQALEKILANVVGFDLNPLAVISARTNYLLALGDLLQHRRGEINIPVYLADSILTPSAAVTADGQMSLDKGAALFFRTAVGTFSVPRALVSAQYIDDLANLLEDCVTSRVSRETFRSRLLHTFPLDERKDAGDIEVALALFDRLAELDRGGINGIWARIIKNAFAPLFCGEFDYVAGNPPWVSWENLPDQYRSDTAHFWGRYHLFADDQPMRRQGSARSQSDISALMLYVCADRYLRPNGVLGFVITQTLFKSERGSRGFRRFCLPADEAMKVIHVDDMVRLQPFEGATNRTSVVVLRRGRGTTYPVPYMFWRKASRGTSLPQDLMLGEVLGLTKRSRWVARPVQPRDNLSPWITGRPGAVKSTSKSVGSSPYLEIARKGADTRGANGVYWLEVVGTRPDGLLVVSNRPDLGRREAETCQAPVESALVQPLLRGEDVQRWVASPSLHIVLPYASDGGSSAIAEETLGTAYPRALSFLRRFETVLRERPKFRNFDPSTSAFYLLYNVGTYTFAPHKVVWREQASGLVAAVVSNRDDKTVVPDHKLVMAPFQSQAEAHFLCACLNSSAAQFIVRSYSIETSISTHVLNYVKIPRFENGNPVHRELSRLSQAAHEAAARGDTETVAQIEAEIDEQTKALWGLTDAELKDIRDSLEELRGG